MKIRVKDDSLGECIVNSFVDIDKNSEYLIKSLSAFILLCMNSTEDPNKHKELAAILKEAADKANDLFSEDLKEVNINGTELFS
jgi:hypothetical protein